MNSNKCRLFYFLFISVFAFSQENKNAGSIPASQIKILNANYKDFIVVNNDIYAVTNGDSLVVFNLETNKVRNVFLGIVAVAKTSKDVIYFLDQSGVLNITSDFVTIEKSGKIKGKSANISVDINDNYVVISDEGIYYQKFNYVPFGDDGTDRSKFNEDNDQTEFFAISDVAFINSKNQMILTYDYGEFGGNILYFDLNTKKFLKVNDIYIGGNLKKISYYKSEEYYEDLLTTFPNQIKRVGDKIVYKFPNGLPIYSGVKGISENNAGDILISQSMMHFTVSGSLYLYKESELPNFNYAEKIKNVLEYSSIFKENDSLAMLQEYLGPTCFNPFDNSFYYYSDKGFFKISKDKDSYSKALVFKPKLKWTSGMAHSVGYQMSVKKFEFISENELVFLTVNNGIGYYNGKVVKYFK